MAEAQKAKRGKKRRRPVEERDAEIQPRKIPKQVSPEDEEAPAENEEDYSSKDANGQEGPESIRKKQQRFIVFIGSSSFITLRHCAQNDNDQETCPTLLRRKLFRSISPSSSLLLYDIRQT